MTFEEWMGEYGTSVPYHITGRKHYLTLWKAATKAERERCCAAIAVVSTEPIWHDTGMAVEIGQRCIKEIHEPTLIQD